jgi:hypothetical protein
MESSERQQRVRGYSYSSSNNILLLLFTRQDITFEASPWTTAASVLDYFNADTTEMKNDCSSLVSPSDDDGLLFPVERDGSHEGLPLSR